MLTMWKESVCLEAPEAWVCRTSAVDWSKRTNAPPFVTPTASATNKHEQPAEISTPSADGCLTVYLPTPSCYAD
jgi:hypothetical protein